MGILDPKPPTAAQNDAKYLDKDSASTFAPAESSVSATQPFLARVKRNAEDVTLTIMGDSTGNETTEWVYLFATWLGTQHTTHTVEYYLWDSVGSAWAAPVTISTGTGAQKIKVYNQSVSGWNSYNFLGAPLPAIGALQPHLIMVSLGHNEDVASSFPAAMTARLLALTESVTAACPLADVVMIGQNPSRIDTNQAKRVGVVQQIAAMRGFGFIDVHQHFVDNGIPVAWYADNLHPSATGSAEWAKVVEAHFEYRPGVTPLPRAASSLVVPTENLLTGGDFAGYVSGVPTGWAATGAPNGTKDTAVYDSGKGYSVRLTSSSAVATQLYQALPSPLVISLRGKWVTLAVRMYQATPGGATLGRIGLQVGGGASQTSVAATVAAGNWIWAVLSAYVPAAASSVQANIYVDSSTTGNGDLRLDRVILARGILPRDLKGT